MNEHQQKLVDELMGINSTDEMLEFLDNNIDDIFSIFDNRRINTQAITKKIVNTLSPDILYNLLMYITYDRDDEYLAYDFLYEIFKVNREVFEKYINERRAYLGHFFSHLSKKEDKRDICKDFKASDKAYILKDSFYVDEERINSLFSSNRELISFFNGLSKEEAIIIFSKLPTYNKKAIIMSDLDSGLIVDLMKYYFNEELKSNKNEELKNYLLEALLSTYETGNKTGLLLLLSLCEEEKRNGINLYDSKFDGRAFMSHINVDIVYSHSKALSLAIPKSVVVNKGHAVLFHELGHFLFRSVYSDQVPEEFDEKAEEARTNITKDSVFGGKCFELNSMLERFRDLCSKVRNKFDNQKFDELFQKKVYQFINNGLKSNIIDYMRKNGFDENLINSIESNLGNFNLSELVNVAKYDEINSIIGNYITKLMGEYFMLEDFVNALFAGNCSAYIDPYRIRETTSHSEQYFQLENSRQFNECIADFTSICLSGNIELINFIRELIGEDLFNIFKKYYCDFACFDIPEEDTELRSKIESSLLYDKGNNLDNLETKVDEIPEQELLDYIEEKGEKLFVTPPKATEQRDVYYYDFSSGNKVEMFINKPEDLALQDLLVYRKLLYHEMSFGEKEEIIKSSEVDLDTKQEIIKYDAMEAFGDNENDYSAISSLLNELYIVNTDILNVFHTIENFKAMKNSNPDFSAYDAIYGETVSMGGR